MLRFLTAGESHGPELTVILEGFPAGLPLTAADLGEDLARRQRGFGSGGRMKIEQDAVRLTGGVMGGLTTGAPISMTLANRDFKNWATKDVGPITIPRPGHADLTGAIKYGYRELRLSLERASARETAARVAVGALCKRFLAVFGIDVSSYVTRIGDVVMEVDPTSDPRELFARAEADVHDVRCPDPKTALRMKEAIAAARKNKDTLGGVFEVVALGLPPGLGSHVHWDRRLDGRLMGAMGSIHAIKGVEIGDGFASAAAFGTQVHDVIALGENGALVRPTNRAGGFEGGITTGMPVVVRAAMKPIATTLTPMPSVDLATGQSAQHVYERSDICAVPRAAVVGEAMVAYVLSDALIEKLGGDSLIEMQPRFAALRRAHLDDLTMDARSWRLGYDVEEPS